MRTKIGRQLNFSQGCAGGQAKVVSSGEDFLFEASGLVSLGHDWDIPGNYGVLGAALTDPHVTDAYSLRRLLIAAAKLACD